MVRHEIEGRSVIVDTPLHSSDEGTKAFLETLAPAGTTGVTRDVVEALPYPAVSSFTSGIPLPVDGATARTS